MIRTGNRLKQTILLILLLCPVGVVVTWLWIQEPESKKQLHAIHLLDRSETSQPSTVCKDVNQWVESLFQNYSGTIHIYFYITGNSESGFQPIKVGNFERKQQISPFEHAKEGKDDRILIKKIDALCLEKIKNTRSPSAIRKAISTLVDYAKSIKNHGKGITTLLFVKSDLLEEYDRFLFHQLKYSGVQKRGSRFRKRKRSRKQRRLPLIENTHLDLLYICGIAQLTPGSRWKRHMPTLDAVKGVWKKEFKDSQKVIFSAFCNQFSTNLFSQTAK